MNFFYIFLPLAGAFLLGFSFLKKRKEWRKKYIDDYTFPRGLLEKLGDKHPNLSPVQREQVSRGLKQFFHVHAASGKFVSMPSQVADDLWHEFILYTKAYAGFCNQAFGKFMHHTPAVVLGKQHQNNEGLRRTWWYACKQERINPRTPTRLPLLFALDTQLGIPNGFVYYPQCDKLHNSSNESPVYCGGDFSSSSVDGGISGFGDSSSLGDSFAGGDSSGGGDSGCGGGCGGGGD